MPISATDSHTTSGTSPSIRAQGFLAIPLSILSWCGSSRLHLTPWFLLLPAIIWLQISGARDRYVWSALHMEQTALDNHVHAKVFIISMWFVWQIRCQEKYVHLIALTKLHSCYNLAPKAPLLLCFLEKKIKTYDSSNKNYDAACSLDSCSKNTKSLLIIILYSYIAGRKMKGKVKEAKEVPWGKLENSCFSQTTSEEPDSVMYINESSSSISC